MEYIDFLNFIQAATLFNFGAMFWREKAETDLVETLFNNSEARKYFLAFNDNNIKDFDQNAKNVESWSKSIVQGKKSADLTKEDIKFFELKDELLRLKQQIINIAGVNNSKVHSRYFNFVCFILALYGLLQWYFIPILDNLGNVNFYLYFTEAIGIFLFWYLIKEVRYISSISSSEEPEKKRSWVNEIFGASYWGFAIKFIILLGICLLLWIYTENGLEPLFSICCSERMAILLSFLLPFASYIVYFALSFYDFCIRSRKDMKRHKKLCSLYETVYQELEKIANKI